MARTICFASMVSAMAILHGGCTQAPASPDSGAPAPDAGPDGAATPIVWPNEESSANSDTWLVEHHAEIRLMRPRILALNFVNHRTIQEMVDHLEQAIDAIAESSRFRAEEYPEEPPFLHYEIAYTVDLTDASPPAGWPHRNSTLYPREDPVDGYWGFDYEQLFTTEFADLYAIPDPGDPSRNLTLCELIEHGLVHEVWIYGDGDVPDVNAAEILELKPYYDENLQRLPRDMNRCAGNGCFDAEDDIPADCTRTVRIAWFNNTRGVGCFLESLSHGFESTAGSNPNQIPYLSRYFIPFAGFDLRGRYGLSFDSWYACAYDSPPSCLSYPTETSVSWDARGDIGLVDPYDPICGNVHFTPNSRGHYDLASTFSVQTTCRSYRRATGEAFMTFTRTAYDGYDTIAPDCMGPWLVWWRRSFPGLNNDAVDDDGQPMLNWWPFLFY